MKAAIKIFFLALLLGFASPSAFAQKPIEEQRFRSYSEEKLEEFRSDPDFRYQRPQSGAPGWWKRFVEWIQEIIGAILGAAPSGKAILYIIYTISILIILWVMIRLTGMDINTVFGRNVKGSPIGHKITEEHIHQIDFESEMNRARSEGKWRLLIRLQYLYALKRLADAGILQVKPGKTNHDYIYEITDELRGSFSELSRIFEYTWYGHFEANAKVVERSERELTNLKSKIPE